MNVSGMTPDLMPPPEFQERFKFVVCSSRLLHDRPNFDGKRDDTLIQHGVDLDISNKQGLELSLAGLGIEGTSMDFMRTEAETGPSRQEGLRRRRAPSPLVDVSNSSQPASFRRPSSATTSTYSDFTPLSAAYPTAISADSGWRFLASMPFFCTLAPYTEPMVLLLSCSLWILQIVGWIWLEVLAAMAIALCGILNIVVRSMEKEEISREEIKRRKGIHKRTETKNGKRRHMERYKIPTSDAVSIDRVDTEENRTLRAIPKGSDPKILEQTTMTSGTNLPSEPRQQHGNVKEEDGSQSFHGLALESLQAVVAGADQMDEVIGQALSMIRHSERYVCKSFRF